MLVCCAFILVSRYARRVRDPSNACRNNHISVKVNLEACLVQVQFFEALIVMTSLCFSLYGTSIVS